jgi:hypothetical protein
VRSTREIVQVEEAEVRPTGSRGGGEDQGQEEEGDKPHRSVVSAL